MGILKNSMARPRSDRIEAMCDGNGETNEWVFELFPNLKEFLTQLKGEHGMTVVLAGQNVEFARRASHRFVLLDRASSRHMDPSASCRTTSFTEMWPCRWAHSSDVRRT